MLITAVEPRRKSLCAIYIDGEFALNLDAQVTLEQRIQPGLELDDERLRELIQLSDTRRAKEKALWLMSYRDHSKNELRKKLERDTSPEAAESTLERLEELGLIDDERYAQRLAKELFETKKLSSRAVKYKLIEKGIDKQLAEDIVCEFSPDEEQLAYELLNKKYYRSMFDEKGRKRAIAALQRSGYSWSCIKEAMSRFDDENDICDEEDDY